VLLWHWQGYFTTYAARYVARSRLLPARRPRLEIGKRSLQRRIGSRLHLPHKHPARLDLYRHFYEKSDFGDLLRDGVWWKRDVFA
jgi:hypothetical protein